MFCAIKPMMFTFINILYECTLVFVLIDIVSLCNRNCSWLALSREVDRMRGLWSASCSPVNRAQGRGSPLGDSAFIFCWQGRMGRALNTVFSEILYVCLRSSLANSIWKHQKWGRHQKDTSASATQGSLYETDERFLRNMNCICDKCQRFEASFRS